MTPPPRGLGPDEGQGSDWVSIPVLQLPSCGLGRRLQLSVLTFLICTLGLSTEPTSSRWRGWGLNEIPDRTSGPHTPSPFFHKQVLVVQRRK